MKGVRSDGDGRKLGVSPTLLVVPDELEGAGSRLINNDTRTVTVGTAPNETTVAAANEWKGTAELIVSLFPYAVSPTVQAQLHQCARIGTGGGFAVWRAVERRASFSPEGAAANRFRFLQPVGLRPTHAAQGVRFRRWCGN